MGWRPANDAQPLVLYTSEHSEASRGSPTGAPLLSHCRYLQRLSAGLFQPGHEDDHWTAPLSAETLLIQVAKNVMFLEIRFVPVATVGMQPREPCHEPDIDLEHATDYRIASLLYGF